MQRSPTVTVPARDISGIADNPSVKRDVELQVNVMRSATFLVVDGSFISIDRQEWDKIRALSPPTD